MSESQSDLFNEAEARRDLGMANVESGQEHKSPGWNGLADRLLAEFLCFRHSEPFLTEDFIRYAEGKIEAPRDPRVWGPVVKRAKTKGLIKCVGYAPAKSSNLSPKCQWQALA